MSQPVGPAAAAPAVGGQRLVAASQWQLIRWRFFRHKVAVGALIILAILYLSAIFAEFVAPYDPLEVGGTLQFAPPQRPRFIDAHGRFHLRPFVYELIQNVDPKSRKTTYKLDGNKLYPIRLFVRSEPYKMWGLLASDMHLFGAPGTKMSLFGRDRLGRDVFSRTIHGARVSLTIGLVGIAMSLLIGIVIGGISGYAGGRADLLIQRLIEIIRSIPTLPLWMGLSVAVPRDWSITATYFAISMILAVVGWTGVARVVRGKFMSLREEDFVIAAQLYGAGEARIIFKHLLPSFYSYLIADLTLSVPGMILGETALSFLGLGMQAPAISWGVLLADAQFIRVLANAPWLLIPGLFVVLTILAFNFVGDGLRDAADPYAAT